MATEESTRNSGVLEMEPVVKKTNRPVRLGRTGTVGTEPSAGQKEREMTRTHRCRLYTIRRNFLPGKDLVAEYWDRSSSDQAKPTGLPAHSEFLQSFVGPTTAEVRKQVDDYRRDHGDFFRGDWTSRGSI